MTLRSFALACVLLAPISALACTPGDMVTLTRDEDGAIFNPDGMAQAADRTFYRGLFEGRTVYLTTAPSAEGGPIGTSAFRAPRSGLVWDSDLGAPEEGAVVADVAEGPLQGRWRATCQATN